MTRDLPHRNLTWKPLNTGLAMTYHRAQKLTGQLADTPTRGLPTRGLDNSRTGQLADWSTSGLDKSRTGQLAVLQMSPKERQLSTQSRRWHPRVVQSATCPARELTSPQDVQSASWQSASCLVTAQNTQAWSFCDGDSYV